MEKNIVDIFTNNNFDKAGTDNLSKFLGFNQNIYLDPALNGFGFIFVTKPALFLYPQKPIASDYELNLAYENMSKDPYFTMFITDENDNEKDKLILKQLSYFDFSDVSSLFLPIFTNSSKNFNPSDLTLDSVNSFTTREGYSIPVPTHITASEAANSISISINETDNYDITKMLTLWVRYIANVTNGTFNANPEMIKQNMLDYTCSIYYFLVGPDGRTLKYWCRYTSCFPTTVPYSNFAYQRGSIDPVVFDVNFQYALKEDMNPRILEDFNMLSLKMVTPTFTNDSYAAFLMETEEIDVNGYTPFASNSLLSKEKLYSGNHQSIVTDKTRDPLVFFERGTKSDSVPEIAPSRYVLSFSENSIANEYASTLTDNNDFNYSELTDK